ncbi:glycoside hydrolase family 31 protein [Leptolyngbya sp. AN02str]|uniref:glycoside hydrolase family 31 protein n=1 Tax=Leptolyngbya sp. AN02str TaxID=3423363 RepID=UPI003D31CAFB
MPQYFGQLPGQEQQWSKVGRIKSITVGNTAQEKLEERHLTLQCEQGLIRISILAMNLVRIRVTPTAEFLPRRSWAVTQPDDAWESVAFDIQETDTHLQIQTEQMRLTISRDRAQIQCFDAQQRPFACDSEDGTGWRQGAIASWKRIEPEEHFYGFGERTGLLDKRSEIKTNWTTDALDYGALTDEMYQAIPFMMALRPDVGYGIFLNSTYWSQFDLGVEHPGLWRMETQAPELDYYLIYGPEPAQILYTYTHLTGRMPLPPKWALGYHQCRWSYDSETVVKQLAQEFRQRQIPCDVIHLDIDYMRGYRVFTWSPTRFPNPASLIHSLAQNGFKTVTIVDPGVKYEPEANYSVFDEGLEQDYFVRHVDGRLFHGYVWPDKAVFPDFLRPEVRQWWGTWHRALVDAGVAGIWNDMNEPSIADRPFGDDGNKIFFPLDALQGPADEQTTHREAHNLYGLTMAQACAEGLEQLRPNQRSFVLTRSGFAGIQRWSSVWMGDNHSLWEHLEMSLPMLCNMGLSGVGFVGCDVGGFASNATGELFARWVQMGMLYPLMRGHSALSTDQHEPWVFGDRIEQICREYIQLRYQLLPYLYTLFWEAATTGAPILRPLLYHYPNDPRTYALYDQVLLGPSLMAAPVYRPGVEQRAVYLPEGVWYDWWTGDRFEGPTYILAAAPLECMPLYAKAGAIIPMQPVMQFVDEHPLSPLTLKVYPGSGEGILYEDDGHTLDHRSGLWATTHYSVTPHTQHIEFCASSRQGQYRPPARQVIVDLVGIGQHHYQDDGTAQTLTW